MKIVRYLSHSAARGQFLNFSIFCADSGDRQPILSETAKRAAASRATGTRYGEQLT